MPKTILLAEDYENDALLTKKELARAGVKNHVFEVRDGAEAIAYIQGHGEFADRDKFPLPSVLLLDLKMPNRDGFYVLEWLKANPPKQNILIVVLSGSDEIYRVKLAYALGAKSFLLKPPHFQDIQNLVRAYPTHWDLEPENAQTGAGGQTTDRRAPLSI
jgi:CheY-like chemotaxis protein